MSFCFLGLFCFVLFFMRQTGLWSYPDLCYVSLQCALPKGIPSISCLFSLFLIPLSFLLLPWFVRFLLWVWVSRPSLSQRSPQILFWLDWEESMRCYLAGHKWILLLWFSFPWGPTIFDVLSSISFGLGMLRFVEKEVEAKFREWNYSVLQMWGKLVLFFPAWDPALWNSVFSRKKGPAVLKHSSLFL